jgi:hypothetical protein
MPRKYTRKTNDVREVVCKFHLYNDGVYDYYYDGRKFEKQFRYDNGIRKMELSEDDYLLMAKIGWSEIYARKCQPLPKCRPARSYEFNPFSRYGFGELHCKWWGGR